jgi:hypothetical protein
MAGKYRSENKRSEFDHDFTQLPAAERPNTRQCAELSREALLNKQWLFDPGERTWYSPEELMDQYGRVGKGAEDLFNRLQIRDPLEAINEGYQKTDEIRKRLETFTLRVAEYYKNKAR